MGRAADIRLERLGTSDQAAIRALLDAFRHRGWRDAGAALAIVNALTAASGPVSARRVASRVPTAFLVQNDVRRGDLEAVLLELAGHPHAGAKTSRV